MRNLNEIAEDIHFTGRSKGFTPPNRENISQKLMLTVTELAEAFEELRDGHRLEEIYFDGNVLPYHAGADLSSFPKDKKPEGFPIEIADAIIRLLHIAHSVGININDVVELKLAFNKTRPEKHGRLF